MWYKMLQEEYAFNIGWLLYSTQETDTCALVNEISDTIGTNMGLRWKIIATGAKSPNSKTKVQALHVEVASNNM